MWCHECVKDSKKKQQSFEVSWSIWIATFEQWRLLDVVCWVILKMRRWARFEVLSRLVWYIGMPSCDCAIHGIEKCRVDENSWSKPPHLSRQSLAAVREWYSEVRYCEISLEFLSKKTARESFVFTRLVKIKQLGQGYEKQQNTTYQVVGLKRDQ